MEIGKTELKKILKEQREEFQVFIGTLVENFTMQVKLLAESVSGLQKQIVVIRDMVARNTEDIEVIKMDIEMMKNMLRKKVDAEEFASLEKRVLILERNR